MTEVELLKQRVSDLEAIVNKIVRPERYVFERPLSSGAKGLIIGRESDKIGFFSADPVNRYALFFNTGNVDSGLSFSAGGTLTDNTSYNGALGSTYYFIPDIVRALKKLGILPM